MLGHHFSNQVKANNMSDVLFSTHTHTQHINMPCTHKQSTLSHLADFVHTLKHQLYYLNRSFLHAQVYTLTEKSMFFLSWFTARGSGTGSVCLSTETDSPVRMDWSTLSVVERMDVSLMSAGTLSPTAKRVKGSKLGLFYLG